MDSIHVKDFEKKYGAKITDDEFISKNLLKKEGIEKLLAKSRSDYYSTNNYYPRVRLASFLLGRKSRLVDNDISNYLITHSQQKD